MGDYRLLLDRKISFPDKIQTTLIWVGPFSLGINYLLWCGIADPTYNFKDRAQVGCFFPHQPAAACLQFKRSQPWSKKNPLNCGRDR